jgi:hypothetical protein
MNNDNARILMRLLRATEKYVRQMKIIVDIAPGCAKKASSPAEVARFCARWQGGVTGKRTKHK